MFALWCISDKNLFLQKIKTMILASVKYVRDLEMFQEFVCNIFHDIVKRDFYFEWYIWQFMQNIILQKCQKLVHDSLYW